MSRVRSCPRVYRLPDMYRCTWLVVLAAILCKKTEVLLRAFFISFLVARKPFCPAMAGSNRQIEVCFRHFSRKRQKRSVFFGLFDQSTAHILPDSHECPQKQGLFSALFCKGDPYRVSNLRPQLIMGFHFGPSTWTEEGASSV
jgi:hypothetical protein